MVQRQAATFTGDDICQVISRMLMSCHIELESDTATNYGAIHDDTGVCNSKPDFSQPDQLKTFCAEGTPLLIMSAAEAVEYARGVGSRGRSRGRSSGQQRATDAAHVLAVQFTGLPSTAAT